MKAPKPTHVGLIATGGYKKKQFYQPKLKPEISKSERVNKIYQIEILKFCKRTSDYSGQRIFPQHQTTFVQDCFITVINMQITR